MSLTLYNTLTRRKEPFRPLDPANVRMYVCGPTVYDHAHIGNARPVIVFDVLYRLLRHLYGPAHVTYARNITDVDDKIVARARADFPDLPMNEAIRRITTQTEKQFHDDVRALGCLEPTVEPRATDYVRRDDGQLDMITLIQRLIDKGCAYEAEGHVLFDVAKMPDYGKLARRSLDEMIAGARVEVAPYKRNPMDFVLWKPSAQEARSAESATGTNEQEARSAESATGKNGDHEPGWDSPWGRGRPGWHIECSAMAAALLGETFDIHGGGIDLVFPHHENEIAQSRCAFHTDSMAQVWMHNGYLQVEGQKMAKSLGNFVTVSELLKSWEGYRWPGEALRFNMLRTHYRQPLDWTVSGLDESHKTLWDWAGQVEDVAASPEVPQAVVDALGDDLNTPKAIAEMHKLANEERFAELTKALHFLGFSGRREKIKRHPRMKAEPGKFIVEGQSSVLKVEHSDGSSEFDGETELRIETLIAARAEARKAKDFAEADRIRDELAELGIRLKDNPDGTTTREMAR